MANVLSEDRKQQVVALGATEMVAAPDRSGDACPSGDGERLPARGGGGTVRAAGGSTKERTADPQVLQVVGEIAADAFAPRPSCWQRPT